MSEDKKNDQWFNPKLNLKTGSIALVLLVGGSFFWFSLTHTKKPKDEAIGGAQSPPGLNIKSGQCYKINDFFPTQYESGYTIEHIVAGIEANSDKVTQASHWQTINYFKVNDNNYQIVECSSETPTTAKLCPLENFHIKREYSHKGNAIYNIGSKGSIVADIGKDTEVFKLKQGDSSIRGGSKIQQNDIECVVVDPCLQASIKGNSYGGIAVYCPDDSEGTINYYLTSTGLHREFASTKGKEVQHDLSQWGEIGEYGGKKETVFRMDLMPSPPKSLSEK